MKFRSNGSRPGYHGHLIVDFLKKKHRTTLTPTRTFFIKTVKDHSDTLLLPSGKDDQKLVPPNKVESTIQGGVHARYSFWGLFLLVFLHEKCTAQA